MAVTAALVSGGAGAAQAADKKLDFTVRQEAATPVSAGKTLKTLWDARRGKWGLTFGLDQSDARPSTLNDVAAGAYFRITPSLRVGGSVALGDQQLNAGPKKPDPADGQPRVRLETKWKF